MRWSSGLINSASFMSHWPALPCFMMQVLVFLIHLLLFLRQGTDLALWDI